MDSIDGPLLWGLIFVLLLYFNFVLSGFMGAVDNLPDIPPDDEEGSRMAPSGLVQAISEDPTELIYTRRFWQLVLMVPLVRLAHFYAGADILRMFLAGAVIFVICFVLGTSFPYSLGRHYVERFSAGQKGACRVLMLIAKPFVFLLKLITGILLYPFHIRPGLREDDVTEDEIISMVNEGHEQGVLDEHEAEMIQNIFELDDKEARDIMTHRKNINAIAANTPLTEAIAYMAGQTNSRFPVYDGSINNIIGVLHFRDAMIFHYRKSYDDIPVGKIPNLLRNVIFIPETRDISRLFRSLQAQKLQMAVVVDEYGETAGLVTMEDILEEIVGNILDESDEEQRMIIPQADDSYLMDGMSPLRDVEEVLDISLNAPEYDTLNGYLVSRLDRIPGPDDHSSVEAEGYEFTIREVAGKTIKWVAVTKSEKTSPPDAKTPAAGADETVFTGIKKEKKE